MNIEELEKLSQLKEKGIITDEEFEKEKKKILNTNETVSSGNNVKIYKNQKRCKTCGNLIANNANICPKCGRDDRSIMQKNPILGCFGVLMIILGIGIIGSTFDSVDSNNVTTSNNSISSSYQEAFTLESMEGHVDDFGISLHIVGTIKNNKNKSYSYVQVTFNLYDKNGAQLGTALANINNLEPYGTWRYDALGLVANVEDVASYKLADISGF